MFLVKVRPRAHASASGESPPLFDCSSLAAEYNIGTLPRDSSFDFGLVHLVRVAPGNNEPSDYPFPDGACQWENGENAPADDGDTGGVVLFIVRFGANDFRLVVFTIAFATDAVYQSATITGTYTKIFDGNHNGGWPATAQIS